MKTHYLFPYKFKKISGILFFVSLVWLVLLYANEDVFASINAEVPVFAVIGEGETVFETNAKGVFSNHYFTLLYNAVLDEILFAILIISGLVFAFSKEKIEDEMIMKIQLDSLVWATYFNYIIILLGYLFVYGLPFLQVMMVSTFSILLFFIIRFRWAIYKYYNTDYHEK